LSFDGVDDYVGLGNPSSLNFANNSFTLVVWYKGGDFNNERFFPNYTWVGGVLCGYYFFYNAVAIGDATVQNSWSYSAPTSSNFQFLAAVFDRTNNKIKVFNDGNKILEQSITVSGNLCNVNKAIGGGYGSFAYYIIDEPRIYNRALSDSEIKALYESTK
jgi:hypothetical protein